MAMDERKYTVYLGSTLPLLSSGKAYIAGFKRRSKFYAMALQTVRCLPNVSNTAECAKGILPGWWIRYNWCALR
jgi:hypothetical protein